MLIPLVDVVFISKDFAQHNGLKSKEETFETYIKLCGEDSVLVCPWGEDGALAGTTDGQTHNSNIYPPDKVIDTLGAGTFNLNIQHAFRRGLPTSIVNTGPTRNFRLNIYLIC